MNYVISHEKSILFFKAEGDEDTKFQKLMKEDFVLIFMDEFQEEMLRKFHNNVIAYDCTHNTNPNKFLLHVMMVLDECEGLAVAFMLCKRSHEIVCEIFLDCIKERVGLLLPNTVITDMQMSFQNAFVKIMGYTPRFALWCLWHVYEKWRLNLNEISDKKKRKSTIKSLYRISQITDKDIFEFELVEFLSNDDPALSNFLNYFEGQYARKATYWAYCYRINAKINVNMVVESFNSYIKIQLGKAKKIKTVRQCLSFLKMYVQVKKKYRKSKNIRPQRTEKLKVLRNRHHRAVKFSEKYIIDAFDFEDGNCSHTWLISSFEKDKKENDGHEEEIDKEGNEQAVDEEMACLEDQTSEEQLQMFIVVALSKKNCKCTPDSEIDENVVVNLEPENSLTYEDESNNGTLTVSYTHLTLPTIYSV